MDTQYSTPANTLLTKGTAHRSDNWAEYQELGLSEDHIPELIRMLTDQDLHREDSESDKVWAPLHAWRVLGCLQAAQAVPALLDQLYRIDEYEDDWVGEELPEVFALIGEPAVPGLTRYLADAEHSLFARVAAAHGLAEVGRRHPETRQSCVAGLEKEISRNDSVLNGFLVSYLLDLKAVETLPAIQQAYQDDCVDLTICGDLEEVELALGIRETRSTPRPRYGIPVLFCRRKRKSAESSNQFCPLFLNLFS